MIELDPNHPFLQRGRRHGRDVLESAARVVKAAAETSTADATSTLSTALQLLVSTALVDGFDAHEVYAAATSFMAWMVCRLPETDRVGVLTAITSDVVDRVMLASGQPLH